MMLLKFPEALLNLSLLAGALAFCWQNLLDYLGGGTGYASTQQPLTLNDLPSLTFCWKLWESSELLRYNKNFIIDMKVKNSKDQSIITLTEDIFVPTQLGFDIHLSELHQRIKDSELMCWNSFTKCRNLQLPLLCTRTCMHFEPEKPF